jgi:hypothetical protein
MTRKVVAFEGKETVDKRLILPNALTLDETTIPVVMYLDKFGSPTNVGKANTFKRVFETGEISFDILTDNKAFEDLTAVIFVTNMVTHMNEDAVMVIESAIIRSINLVSSDSAWRNDE